MKKNFLLIAFSALAMFSCSKQHEVDDLTATAERGGCSMPSNVTVTWQSANSLSFTWDAVAGASQYRLSYTPQGAISSANYFTDRPSYTFSNLQPGTYEFRIATVCPGGTSSDFIIIEDIIR